MIQAPGPLLRQHSGQLFIRVWANSYIFDLASFVELFGRRDEQRDQIVSPKNAQNLMKVAQKLWKTAQTVASVLKKFDSLYFTKR